MRFLADENCDQRLIAALRSEGHDVESIREMAAGIDDAEVLARALREKRVLLTEDKGFGRLIYRESKEACGVILIRVSSAARTWLIRNIPAIVREYELKHAGRFAVVSRGQLRMLD